MRQSWVVAQLTVLVARDVVDLADGREHFRLLDSVNPEVGFEVEVQVQHVFGIAGLFHHQFQNALFHGVASTVGWKGHCYPHDWLDYDRSRRRPGCYGRHGRGRDSPSKIRPLLIHESDYMCQGWIVAQLAVLVARDVVDLADGREHFRLLDRVDTEISFEVEIHVQHVLWVTRLFHHQREDAFLYRIACRGLLCRRRRHCHYDGNLGFRCGNLDWWRRGRRQCG